MEIAFRPTSRAGRSVAYVSPAAKSVVFKILEPGNLKKEVAEQTADLSTAATASVKLPIGKVRLQASMFDWHEGLGTEIATGEATADIKVLKDKDGKGIANTIKLHMSPVIKELKVSLPDPWWSAATAPVKLEVLDARGDVLQEEYDATVSLQVKTTAQSGNLGVDPFLSPGKPKSRSAAEGETVYTSDARDSLVFHSDEEEVLVAPEDEGKETVCASIPGSNVRESCVKLGHPNGYHLVGTRQIALESIWGPANTRYASCSGDASHLTYTGGCDDSGAASWTVPEDIPIGQALAFPFRLNGDVFGAAYDCITGNPWHGANAAVTYTFSVTSDGPYFPSSDGIGSFYDSNNALVSLPDSKYPYLPSPSSVSYLGVPAASAGGKVTLEVDRLIASPSLYFDVNLAGCNEVFRYDYSLVQ